MERCTLYGMMQQGAVASWVLLSQVLHITYIKGTKKHTHNCKEQPTYSLRLLLVLLLISELGTLTAIFLMQKERHLLAHPQFFLEHWTCPHRSTSLEPQTNVLP
jgi:hypothetical protein